MTFTCLVNIWIIQAVKPIISPIQPGFLPGKFIGENGLAARLVIEYARHHHLPRIGLLLDQE